MLSTPFSNQHRSITGTLFLVIALLFAQWLGLAHRIDHSDLQQTIAQAQGPLLTSPSDGNIDKSLDHSCALFDGAALATALNSPAVVPAILPAAQVLALWQAYASWDAPFLCHFSSRAPPAV